MLWPILAIGYIMTALTIRGMFEWHESFDEEGNSKTVAWALAAVWPVFVLVVNITATFMLLGAAYRYLRGRGK